MSIGRARLAQMRQQRDADVPKPIKRVGGLEGISTGSDQNNSGSISFNPSNTGNSGPPTYNPNPFAPVTHTKQLPFNMPQMGGNPFNQGQGQVPPFGQGQGQGQFPPFGQGQGQAPPFAMPFNRPPPPSLPFQMNAPKYRL